jgi:hypothetical protein
MYSKQAARVAASVAVQQWTGTRLRISNWMRCNQSGSSLIAPVCHCLQALSITIKATLNGDSRLLYTDLNVSYASLLEQIRAKFPGCGEWRALASRSLHCTRNAFNRSWCAGCVAPQNGPPESAAVTDCVLVLSPAQPRRPCCPQVQRP